MKKISFLAFTVVFAVSCLGLLQPHDHRVADVFSDHAVLQQGVSLPVWGMARPNEKVTVVFAGQTQSVRSAEDGSWLIKLSPLQAERAGRDMTVESGGHQVAFRDLLVGEVWYASGQSNMQMKLDTCAKKIPLIREITNAPATNNIRMLRVDDADSEHPLKQRQNATAWQVDDPDNRRKQSAVAYLFARRLHQTLGVPIGIIDGSWGAKPIEGFIPRSQFQEHKVLQPILSLAEADKLTELAKLKGGMIVRNTAGMPGRIFNARIAPLAPYALRGFIWYQGESNAGRGEDPRNYRFKMRALVDGLRTTWGQPELPLYFVQLPAFKEQASGWVRLREEQRRSLNIQHTGMAVTIDLRDSDIHPANKLDVGERLALWALAKSYGKLVSFSGPIFRSATIDGDSIRVEFDYSDGGLITGQKDGVAATKPTPGVAPAHFELADQSGVWHPASATLHDTWVQVRSDAVKIPRAVRYACSGAPDNANLYNQAGLPASPFCSDLKLLPWDPPE